MSEAAKFEDSRFIRHAPSVDNSPPTIVPFPSSDFIIAEFVALRDEVQKRSEAQNQILSLTLIAAGSFITLGVQTSLSAQALLVYPILGMFLAAAWSQNSTWVYRISSYIRTNFESHLNGAGWEHYIVSAFKQRRWRFSTNVFAARGVFLVTQILVIALAVTRFTFAPLQIAFLMLDVIAVIITAFLLQSHRKKYLGS